MCSAYPQSTGPTATVASGLRHWQLASAIAAKSALRRAGWRLPLPQAWLGRRASLSTVVYTKSPEGMPPRRRRAGSRPGRLSNELKTAIAHEAARLENVGGPAAVVRAVGDAFAALDGELEQLSQVRLRAVGHLRGEGWTYQRIADATGLSLARVAQLARAVRAGGRAQPPATDT